MTCPHATERMTECNACKEIAALKLELLLEREALDVAVRALKSTVGFEPFDSLEPRKVSEALARIKELKGKV